MTIVSSPPMEDIKEMRIRMYLYGQEAQCAHHKLRLKLIANLHTIVDEIK